MPRQDEQEVGCVQREDCQLPAVPFIIISEVTGSSPRLPLELPLRKLQFGDEGHEGYMQMGSVHSFAIFDSIRLAIKAVPLSPF